MGVSLSVCLPQGHGIPCELEDVFQVPEPSLRLKKGKQVQRTMDSEWGQKLLLQPPSLLFWSPLSPLCPHLGNGSRHASGGQAQACQQRANTVHPCSRAAPWPSTPVWSQGLVWRGAPRRAGGQCGPGVVPGRSGNQPFLLSLFF